VQRCQEHSELWRQQLERLQQRGAETYGSNNDTSYIIVADMSQVVVGVRTQNTVLYDPFSNASTGQIQMITTSRVAFNVLATEAIEIIEGVRTS
jgi:HK97 family phage major capsid protein